MKHILKIAAIVCIVLGIASCSSAPKRPAEITSIRGIGRTQLQLANHKIDQGDYDGALVYLEEAWSCAVRTDDPELRIKTRLSRGNIFLYQGKGQDARSDWNAALTEAQQEGKSELSAAANIHIARGKFLEAAASGSVGSSLAAETETAVLKDEGNIKNEILYLALAWATAGLAQKEQGLWDKAEASLKNALKIHESGNYLEQAAYDWYLIASVRSKAQRYSAAIEALMEAVSFDRRSENSYGLGSDWSTLGDVYAKMGETQKAKEAYTRALEIFNTISMEHDSAFVKQKLGKL